MHKIFFSLLVGIASAAGSLTATAQTTVATVPDALMTLTLTSGTTNYLSIPLTSVATFTGMVANVTTNSITVDDSPAPFGTSFATPSTPYFVKFLSGNEAGRVMLVTASTANGLTVDTTDHVSGEAVALTSTGFDVQEGDTFEVFKGDTLASIFGDNSAGNPLMLTGAPKNTESDIVSLLNTSAPAISYYFNTTAGYWEQMGSTANANHTLIYPYAAFTVDRLKTHPDTTLTLGGRVAEVSPDIKVVSKGVVYTSSHFATDITLSELQFGPNWGKGTSIYTADTLSVWSPTLNKFQIFYQLPNSTWRMYPNATTDQSNFTITAGTVTTISKKVAVAGAATLLQANLPYSLE